MTHLPDQLREQIQHAQGYRPGKRGKITDLPPSLALTMEPRPDQQIQVGQMQMWQTQRGSIWLQNASGEGMEIPLTRMESHLRQFFKKHF